MPSGYLIFTILVVGKWWGRYILVVGKKYSQFFSFFCASREHIVTVNTTHREHSVSSPCQLTPTHISQIMIPLVWVCKYWVLGVSYIGIKML